MLTGVPLLNDAVANFDCKVWATYDGSTHDIVIGEVVDAEIIDGQPLMYYNRGYHHLVPIEDNDE